MTTRSLRSFFFNDQLCVNPLIYFMALPWLILSVHARAERFENPPLRQAKDILPKELISGKHHSVSSIVSSDGVMNRYTVKSRFEEREILGTYYLVKYITELDAITFIDQNLSSTRVIGEAAQTTAEGMVLGPIRAGRKVYDTVSDKEKLSNTVAAIPGGIVNLFGAATRLVGSVAKGTVEAGQSLVRGGSGEGSTDLNKTLGAAGDYALRYVGYSGSIRELAKQLSIDPYTDNELLQSELKRVATIKSVFKVASHFTPGIYSIPGVGSANRYLGYADSVATYDDPRKVDALSEKVMTAIDKVQGAGSESNDELKKFFENQNYTPPMRHQIAEAMAELKEVDSVEALIPLLTGASSRSVAQFHLFAIRYLARIHRSERPLRSFLINQHIMAATTQDDTLVIPLPVDALYWTKGVSARFAEFKSAAKHLGGIKSVQIISGGPISDRCRAQSTQLGRVTVRQGTFF